MPYKRKFYKKRGRKRPWYKKKYSAMDAGRYALSQIWKLKGLVNVEKKKLDTISTGSAISNSGTIVHLSAIAQGDGDNNRSGNSVYARSLNLKGTLSMHGSASNTFVRMSLVMDTQQIADTSPSFTDIYENSDINSHLNNTTVGRFKVLCSRTYNLSVTNTNKILYINKAMRHHIRYNGSASTDQQKGALYLVFVSNEATNTPNVNYEARLTYIDN